MVHPISLVHILSSCNFLFLQAVQQMSELNANYQEAIIKCLKGRKEEIRNALVETVNAISSAQLQDFDWQLKVRGFFNGA